MAPHELITAIDHIKKAKLEDIQGRINILTNSCFFIVINNIAHVYRTSNLSFIYTEDFEYAFIIMDYTYIVQNQWDKTNWEFAGFISRHKILSSIVGKNWTLSNIYFGFTRHGSMAPCFVFKFNSDLQKEIKYDIANDQFDLAWNFFNELDLECQTFEQGQIYLKYYKERLNTKLQGMTLENFKEELQQKDNLINQYKDLLKLIEDKLKV